MICGIRYKVALDRVVKALTVVAEVSDAMEATSLISPVATLRSGSPIESDVSQSVPVPVRVTPEEATVPSSTSLKGIS